MNAASETSASRSFVPFLDEIDGTLCFPASATAADIRKRLNNHSLRFPLISDPTATLDEQVMASGFAPASSRFGPYCDNILGMNWQLPDGRVVRIGERVVKTTTGYDWFRFLLLTGHRFGHPLDYVLRLRPDCGTTGCFEMSGTAEAIRNAASRLLRDCWMHWFDAVDVIAQNGVGTLRVTVHCPVSEWGIFENYVTDFAFKNGLVCNVKPDIEMPADGCPDCVFKTSPEHVVALAEELSISDGVHCVALCYNGVVHAYLADAADRPERIRDLAQPHIAALHALGGDWHSRHLTPPMPSAIESEWIDTLERESLLP